MKRFISIIMIMTSLVFWECGVINAADVSLKGDINGDGSIDLTDAVLALQIGSSISPAPDVHKEVIRSAHFPRQEVPFRFPASETRQGRFSPAPEPGADPAGLARRRMLSLEGER